jgi:hypothetical protein
MKFKSWILIIISQNRLIIKISFKEYPQTKYMEPDHIPNPQRFEVFT